MRNKIRIYWLLAAAVLTVITLPAHAQRRGNIFPGLVMRHYLIADGPEGPIHGGESAVTDMLLLGDGWVYGSTEATWGGKSCHIFRTDSFKVEHVLNLTQRLSDQPKIKDMDIGPGGILVGVTTTYDETFDDPGNTYEGGHIFSFDPATKAFVDHGVVSRGNGLNCVAVDTVHTRVYTVTYPEGKLFSFDYLTKELKDHGVVMKPWRVKDLGRVSWRGVPKTLFITDEGTVYFSTYTDKGAQKDDQGDPTNIGTQGGRIFRLRYGDDRPVYTGAVVPTQTGMDDDPLYECGIASAIRAADGGFWCGTVTGGFLFKFHPSTSTVINKGKPFQYWNLRSLAYGGDGRLYMLGGRDYDNAWLLRYDTMTGSIECLGWPTHTTQMGVICADKNGRILMAENLRSSYIWVYGESGRMRVDDGPEDVPPGAGGEVRQP